MNLQGTQMDEQVETYLLTTNLVNAASPEIQGSYTGSSPFVSDGSEILFKNFSSVAIKNKKIKIVPPAGNFIEKVEKCWQEFKKTEKGKHEFCGPILSVSDYHMDNDKNDLVLELKLITYADFFMSYLPEFSESEKRGNYSFGASSIIITKDDKFLFGARSGKLSSAGGRLECAGGFLNLKQLIDRELYSVINKYCREGRFWQEVGKQIPSEIEVCGDLHEATNIEKYQEIGIIKENIKSATYLAFLHKNLYQNFDLLDVTHLSVDEKEIREYFEKNSDKEFDEVIFVPRRDINDFIKRNESDITSGLRNALKIYLIGI